MHSIKPALSLTSLMKHNTVSYTISRAPTDYVFFLATIEPLFTYLAHTETLVNTKKALQLSQDLINAIEQIQATLQPYYPEPVIKIASYLLCITCDDLLIKPLTRDVSSVDLKPLLYYFYQDLQGRKRFVAITEVLLKNKNIPHELSTLAYLCLALSQQDLSHSNFNALYNLIQPHFISSAQDETVYILDKTKKTGQYLIFIFLIISFALCVSYAFFTFMLNRYLEDIAKFY